MHVSPSQLAVRPPSCFCAPCDGRLCSSSRRGWPAWSGLAAVPLHPASMRGAMHVRWHACMRMFGGWLASEHSATCPSSSSCNHREAI
eukprot:scaffold109567_cov18-Tisochrysis_lutea.AAC.1